MKPLLSNKAFDILKWVALIALPAFAIFIKRLFPIWGIPLGDEISETMVAIQFFLGALLGVSTIQYKSNENGEGE